MVVCLDDLPPGVSCKELKRLVQDAVDSARRQLNESFTDTIDSHAGGFPPGGDERPASPASLRLSPEPFPMLSWPASIPVTTRSHDQAADRASPGPGPQTARALATLRFRSNVADCAIVRITNKGNGSIRYQGMVAIAPASCALAAVEVLNRSRWHGMPLHARYLRRQTLSVGSAVPAAPGDRRGPVSPDPVSLDRVSLELVSSTPSPATGSAIKGGPAPLGSKKPAFAH